MGLKKFLIFGVFALAAGAFVTSSFSAAGDISLTRTVYFEHGNVVEPKVMARTQDHGLIVAGSSNGQGWAMKTDTEGNFEWRYVTSRRDNPVPGQATFNQAPEYRSAVVMPDDSIFLCGFMPGLKNGGGLLTHLDKNGKILSEQTGLNVAGLGHCIALNGDIISVKDTGTFKQVAPSSAHPEPYDAEYFYQLSAFDATGTMKWEKHIHVADYIRGVGMDISPLQLIGDGTIILAATRSSLGTEIFHLSFNGEILAHKLLDKGFLLAQSAHPESDIVLVSQDTEQTTRITLNSDLQEVERITKPHEKGSTNLAYRLPDRSLMLFGNRLIKMNYAARVMMLDPTLEHEEKLNPGPPGESPWIKAALPPDNSGAFASARGAMKPAQQGDEFCRRTATGFSCDEKKMAEARRGVALDLMKIK